MDHCREILSLACFITCISLLEGENFPDNWWMIILEVGPRMTRVWYHLVCNIPRQYFQTRVAIQHSFESSKKEDTWFIFFKKMQTNGRTGSPVYVSVVNREQKGLVTWSSTSRGSAAIDWPKHSYPERVMLDGFHDLAKPRNSKIQRKPENTILWQGDILNVQL